MRYLFIFITILGMLIAMSCVNDSPSSEAEYQFEKSLTKEQLKEEIDQIKLDDSRMFCLVVCGTLIVPKNDEELKEWSRVSLCRIDLCHMTEACSKGYEGLKERLNNCTDSYAKKDSL